MLADICRDIIELPSEKLAATLPLVFGLAFTLSFVAQLGFGV
jgi:hypothetical protein